MEIVFEASRALSILAFLFPLTSMLPAFALLAINVFLCFHALQRLSGPSQARQPRACSPRVRA